MMFSRDVAVMRWLLTCAVAMATIAMATIMSSTAQERPLEPLVLSGDVERIDLPERAYKGGAMVKLSDGRLLIAVGSADVFEPIGTAKLVGFVSADGGRSWTNYGTLVQHAQYNPGRPTFLRSKSGTLWLVHYGFVAGAKSKDVKPQCDLWITCSQDDGQTWDKPRCIFKGYSAGQRAAIETSSGNLVISFSYAVDNGRNVSATLVSNDQGQTWRQSGPLELGGKGSHSGALEPAVIELQDKRLWMLIRHQEHFWQAFSSDGGLSWADLTRTSISNPPVLGGAPASVIRLSDGRLAMAWNPRTELPVDASAWRKHGRGTLAVAFSSDDGQSWSKPRTCATAASICYPHLLQVEPNVLLLSTGLLKATEVSGKRLATDVILLRVSTRHVPE